MRGKKAISPVVATVLLIVVVLVLATAIFIWALSVRGEEITKFGNDISLACDDVVLSASYSGGELLIRNEGNIPVNSVRVRKSAGTVVECFGLSMAAGQSAASSSCPGIGANPDRVYPVLLGENEDDEEVNYPCDNYFVIS